MDMREYWTANFQAEFKMSMLFKKEEKNIYSKQ